MLYPSRYSARRRRLPSSTLAMVAGILLLLLFTVAPPSRLSVAAASQQTQNHHHHHHNLHDLDYAVFPLRTQEEAAVIEWGHSAIISALDAAVADFGPQTSQAALLEVETMPVLADPVNGVVGDDSKTNDDNNDDNDTPPTNHNNNKLRNAEDIHGNVVVMTNTALDGLDLALLAQDAGAAALLVVNVDDERPDDTYRITVPEGREVEAATIDIPVVVISLSSANVLTTATVEENMSKEEIVNNGMPERIRLYAGGDRPFFEDIEAAQPTIYVIHNLLTAPECEALVEQAKPLVAPLTRDDPLQLTLDHTKYVNTERAVLWQGTLQGPSAKAIEERMEQVTGFPVAHYSDWIVDKLEPGAHWETHYDVIVSTFVPAATVTVFLTQPSGGGGSGGGEMVFPNTAHEPVKIQPVAGMAVVHHNTDERSQFEANAMHAILPVTGTDVVWIARKFVYQQPGGHARRLVLPVVAWVHGGRLPRWIVGLYDALEDQFGAVDGGEYFDKVLIFVPVLLLLGLVQLIVQYVHKQMKEAASANATPSKQKSKKKD